MWDIYGILSLPASLVEDRFESHSPVFWFDTVPYITHWLSHMFQLLLLWAAESLQTYGNPTNQRSPMPCPQLSCSVLACGFLLGANPSHHLAFLFFLLQSFAALLSFPKNLGHSQFQHFRLQRFGVSKGLICSRTCSLAFQVTQKRQYFKPIFLLSALFTIQLSHWYIVIRYKIVWMILVIRSPVAHPCTWCFFLIPSRFFFSFYQRNCVFAFSPNNISDFNPQFYRLTINWV